MFIFSSSSITWSYGMVDGNDVFEYIYKKIDVHILSTTQNRIFQKKKKKNY